MSRLCPSTLASFRAAALFALGWVARLSTTGRLGNSVLVLDHRRDQATAHLISEVVLCSDREASEQRKQEKQKWNET